MAPEIPPGTPAPSERPCERHDDVRDFGGQRLGAGPCVDRDGRVIQHSAYVFPASDRSVLRWSLVAAVLVPVILGGLYFVSAPSRPGARMSGLRSVLAPAPTFSRHSMAILDCAQCHRAGQAVEDARCERCHDVPLSARLSNAAHVFQSGGDSAAALAAPVVRCATCHLEHQGADVHFGEVDDRECGSCHRTARNGLRRLTTLSRHPEFAIVREGVESGSGLRWFNHKLHVGKVQVKFGKTCDACHQRTADGPTFSPISFPAHCAPCHEEDLADSAGTMPAATFAALGPLPPSLRPRTDLDDETRRGVTGVKHADRWILSTVQALRARVNPDDTAVDQTTLTRQIAQLELRQTYGRSAPVARAWTGLGASLREVGAAADRAGSVDDSVRAAAAAIEAFVSELTPQDATTAALLQDAVRLKQGAALPAPGVSASVPVKVDALRQLLAATLARAKAAGDDGLTRRAAVLLGRLEALPAPARQATGQDSSTSALAAIIQDLAMAADPRVRAEAWRLNDLRQMASRQAAGGIDPRAVDLYRQQTLRLLDAAERTLLTPRPNAGTADGTDAVLARVATLRQWILSMDSGAPPAVAAARLAFFRNRERDRARVDTELDAAGLRIAAPAEAADFRQDAAQARLEQLRRQLAAIGSPSRLVGLLPPDEARRAITALLGSQAADAEDNAGRKNRCTLCHELGPAGDQLAPVRAAGGSLLTKARFTHTPHLTADNANCETCHTGVRASTAARDLNLPGVASCMTCHASGRQAARATGCESCHKYHVPSTRALAWTP